MTRYTAKFTNGSEYTTTTKRPTAFAWRVEWNRVDGTSTDAGGFSATRENAEKAMNAWIARIRKGSDNASITFKEVTEAGR